MPALREIITYVLGALFAGSAIKIAQEKGLGPCEQFGLCYWDTISAPFTPQSTQQSIISDTISSILDPFKPTFTPDETLDTDTLTSDQDSPTATTSPTASTVDMPLVATSYNINGQEDPNANGTNGTFPLLPDFFEGGFGGNWFPKSFPLIGMGWVTKFFPTWPSDWFPGFDSAPGNDWFPRFFRVPQQNPLAAKFSKAGQRWLLQFYRKMGGILSVLLLLFWLVKVVFFAYLALLLVFYAFFSVKLQFAIIRDQWYQTNERPCKEKITKLELEISTLKSKNSYLNITAKEQETTLDERNSSLTSKNAAVGELQELREQMANKIVDLQHEVYKQKRTISRRDEAIRKFETDPRWEFDLVSDQLAKTQHALDYQKKSQQEWRAHVRTKEAEKYKRKLDEHATISHEFFNEQQAAFDIRPRLEADIADLKSEIQQVRAEQLTERQSQQTHIDGLAREQDSLQSRLDRVEAERDSARAELIALKAKFSENALRDRAAPNASSIPSDNSEDGSNDRRSPPNTFKVPYGEDDDSSDDDDDDAQDAPQASNVASSNVKANTEGKSHYFLPSHMAVPLPSNSTTEPPSALSNTFINNESEQSPSKARDTRSTESSIPETLPTETVDSPAPPTQPYDPNIPLVEPQLPETAEPQAQSPRATATEVHISDTPVQQDPLSQLPTFQPPASQVKEFDSTQPPAAIQDRQPEPFMDYDPDFAAMLEWEMNPDNWADLNDPADDGTDTEMGYDHNSASPTAVPDAIPSAQEATSSHQTPTPEPIAQQQSLETASQPTMPAASAASRRRNARGSRRDMGRSGRAQRLINQAAKASNAEEAPIQAVPSPIVPMANAAVGVQDSVSDEQEIRRQAEKAFQEAVQMAKAKAEEDERAGKAAAAELAAKAAKASKPPVPSPPRQQVSRPSLSSLLSSISKSYVPPAVHPSINPSKMNPYRQGNSIEKVEENWQLLKNDKGRPAPKSCQPAPEAKVKDDAQRVASSPQPKEDASPRPSPETNAATPTPSPHPPIFTPEQARIIMEANARITGRPLPSGRSDANQSTPSPYYAANAGPQNSTKEYPSPPRLPRSMRMTTNSAVSSDEDEDDVPDTAEEMEEFADLYDGNERWGGDNTATNAQGRPMKKARSRAKRAQRSQNAPNGNPSALPSQSGPNPARPVANTGNNMPIDPALLGPQPPSIAATSPPTSSPSGSKEPKEGK